MSVLDNLSPREREIAEAVGRGLRNNEIAVQLGLSPQTVKNHLSTVFDKLHVESRTRLALLVASGQ